jgi:hypothetical protein
MIFRLRSHSKLVRTRDVGAKLNSNFTPLAWATKFIFYPGGRTQIADVYDQRQEEHIWTFEKGEEAKKN